MHNWCFAIFSEKPRFCSNSQTLEEASADSFGTKPQDLSFAGEMDILLGFLLGCKIGAGCLGSSA